MVPVVVHPLDAPKELASAAAAEPAALLLVAVSGLTGLVAGSGGAGKQHDVLRCDVGMSCELSMCWLEKKLQKLRSLKMSR
jgi:hypothetical protein